MVPNVKRGELNLFAHAQLYSAIYRRLNIKGDGSCLGIPFAIVINAIFYLWAMEEENLSQVACRRLRVLRRRRAGLRQQFLFLIGLLGIGVLGIGVNDSVMG